MRKFTKILITIALVFMCAGLVLMLASFAGGTNFKKLGNLLRDTCDSNGGKRIVKSLANGIEALTDGDYNYDDDDWDDYDDDDLNEFFDKEFSLNDAEFNKKYPIKRNYEYTPSDNIKSLDIDVGAARIFMERGENFSVKIFSGKKRNITSRLESNGKLKIDEEHTSAKRYKGLKNYEAVVRIRVPTDTVLDELDLQINAAAFYADRMLLTVQKFSAELNAGVIRIKKPEQFLCFGTDIDCNAGSIIVEGALRGRTDIDCTAGQVVLKIDGADEAYSWDTDAALGSVKINDNSVSGNSRQRSAAKEKNHIDISCAVGSVDISIE
jgi:hypothetical protein